MSILNSRLALTVDVQCQRKTHSNPHHKNGNKHSLE